MKLTVKAGGVIPTGQYQNYQPEYIIEDEFEQFDDENLIEYSVENKLRAMRDIVEKLYAERDKKFRDVLSAKESPSSNDGKELKIRWYSKDGKVCPSVTSIIHPYGLELEEYMIDEGWTDKDIEMYALRGSIVHAQMEVFLKQGKWMELEGHPAYGKVIEYRSKVVTDDKPILPNACNFKGFIEKHGKEFEFTHCEEEVYGNGFAGRYDAKGRHLGLRARIDVKTASDYRKEKLDDYFTQMAGYDLAEGGDDEVYVVIPLKPSNKCGFGAPIVTKDTAVYKKRFLDKLEELYSIKAFQDQMALEQKRISMLTKG